MNEQEVSDGQMFNVADLHARIKALEAENAEHLKIHKMLSEKCNQLDNDLIIMTNQNSIGRHAWKESDNKITALEAEVERLKGIEIDHLTDWKRIQDAERKCEHQAVIIKELQESINVWASKCLHVESLFQKNFNKSERQAAIIDKIEAEKNLSFESYCKLDDINEKLNEEITKLKDKIEQLKIESQNATLKAQVKIMRDALETFKHSQNLEQFEIAHEALTAADALSKEQGE